MELVCQSTAVDCDQLNRGGEIGYSIVQLDELRGEGPGGAVRFVRRALGVTAFGINHFTLPPDGYGFEHDEVGTGHEEAVLVLAGSGSMIVDGEEVSLRTGSLVRLDPETTRQPHAGPDGLTFITIGSPVTGDYVPHGPF